MSATHDTHASATNAPPALCGSLAPHPFDLRWYMPSAVSCEMCRILGGCAPRPPAVLEAQRRKQFRAASFQRLWRLRNGLARLAS